MRRGSQRTFLISLLLLAALAGGALFFHARHGESTPAMRGEEVAARLGCFACHGPGGTGGIPDPAQQRAGIPGWDGRVLASYVQSEGELRDWILHGAPARLAAQQAERRERGVIPMPAYEGRLSPGELEELLAYVRAVSGFDPGIPDAAFEGRAIAAASGCFGCHGPSGMGGAQNPGSLKGHIPAWEGEEFAELCRDEAELREWILDGGIERLRSSAAARVFLDGQVIQMPAYRALLSEDEVGKLVAYVAWLRRAAPGSQVAPGAVAKGPAGPAGPAGPGAPAAVAAARAAAPAPAPAAAAPEAEPLYRSPVQLAVSPDGATAYAVNQGRNSVSVLDLATRAVIAEIPVGAFPTHAAVSWDGATLYVSCQYAASVDVVDLATRRVVRRLGTGREPQGVAVSHDGGRLFVANYLSDSVSILALPGGEPIHEVPVGRGPRFLAESPDGKRLVVSNGLSRSVSLVDPATGTVVETRDLGQASILRDLVLSPDGRWAFVAHVISRDDQIPLQMERGLIHANGFSVLDLSRPGHRVTLLLDRLLSGAANPYGVALSSSTGRLYFSLSGIHEVAVLELAPLLRLVERATPDEARRLERDVELLERSGIARRVPAGGLVPRGIALALARGELLVADTFSDAVSVLDAGAGPGAGRLLSVIPLGPELPVSLRRKGELLFNDARITFQSWFTCVSCHEEDAGVDALNWDLPNDGTGNTKNVKSLHDAHDTAPAMWGAVRKDMDAAVQAGQRFQGFLPEAENQRALAAYLSTPPRAPNPYREQDPALLARGAALFARARCDGCHPAPKFTDQQKHDLGLGARTDLVTRFDTPSLRECYRSAPYLHDGRARTLEAIFAEHDPEGLHGRVRELSGPELVELLAYVRSL